MKVFRTSGPVPQGGGAPHAQSDRARLDELVAEQQAQLRKELRAAGVPEAKLEGATLKQLRELANRLAPPAPRGWEAKPAMRPGVPRPRPDWAKQHGNEDEGPPPAPRGWDGKVVRDAGVA